MSIDRDEIAREFADTPFVFVDAEFDLKSYGSDRPKVWATIEAWRPFTPFDVERAHTSISRCFDGFIPRLSIRGAREFARDA